MPSAPVIAEHDVTVYQGDVREQLAGLPAESVQCVVTSPPYYGLRDYGADGQRGAEASPREFVDALVGDFAEARRVMSDDGTLWVNLGDSYVANSDGYRRGDDPRRANQPSVRQRESVRLADKNLRGTPWRFAFAMQDDGWVLRNAIVWAKPNAMPDSVRDRLACRYEFVFLFSRSRFYEFDLDAIKVPTTGRPPGSTVENRQQYGSGTGTAAGARRFGGNPSSTLLDIHETRNPGDVWTIPVAAFPGGHFATMPPELARRCILAGCPEGGTVLDPFAGSGTTLKVARSLGRKSVGIELNPDYIDIIRERIGQTPFDFGVTA